MLETWSHTATQVSQSAAQLKLCLLLQMHVECPGQPSSVSLNQSLKCPAVAATSSVIHSTV